jgi:tetratricopeptide (TPR) repeat protein
LTKVWKWGIVIVLCAVSLSSRAQVEDLIRAADAAFDAHQGAFTFDSYEGRLRVAIATYEQALLLIPEDAQQTRSHTLTNLSEACFELGTAYSASRDEQEALFSKGKDYGLASLRLSADFASVETAQGFRAALSAATDVAALFWYGNNLGRYIEFHPLTAITGGMKDVEASFERTTELDEAFLGGGPWRALGSYLSTVPAVLGGDLERAGECLRRAIELGPDYLENYVNYAEYYAKAKKDWASFCEETKQALALAQDEARFARWPLYNTLALRRAQELVALEVGGSPVCPK